MADLVIDASLTAAWCFPDEETEQTAALLKVVGVELIPIAPSLWGYEIRNTILFGLKRNRIASADLPATLAVLAKLDVRLQDPVSFDSILVLAERQALTVYDAAYLDLAMRTNLPLGTLDKALRRAAAAVGVKLFVS